MPLSSRRNPWVLVVAIALAVCACSGGQQSARTRVARVQLVTVGQADYDVFFRAIHSMQIAVNEGEHDRVVLLARFGTTLELGDAATLDAIGAALRTRVTAFPPGTAIRITTRPPRPCQPPEQATGEAWDVAARTFPESQADAERAVTLAMRLDGPSTPAIDPLQQGLARALRSALALQSRMDEIVAFAPQIRAAAVRLSANASHAVPAQATALAPELRDATQFLDGVGARACAESEVAFRIAVRLTASADSTTAATQP